MPSVRRLAAIFAADVAGYSRLMGTDEEGTHERLKAHRCQLVDPKIDGYHGRIVKTTGDGMLVEFPSVVDAVRCAAEIQRAMVDREAELAAEWRIRFRIGINLGDIIADEDDIFGDGVNVAARLEALAEPGGICIARVVRDQIRDKLPYAFEDMGEQSVKNIARPIRAYALSAVAVEALPPVTAPASPRPTRRPSSLRHDAPRLSIVVLPFANLSDDPEQEYFADGITDDLTTDLSRVSGSFVIARNTAFTYKGKPVDATQIGRDLGVRYVLEGSVRRVKDHVRVNVQLIDAETGAHVWADRFEADHRRLAEAQGEITGRLARTLNLELVEDAGRRIEQEQSGDPDAQDLVMRGWAWWNRPRSAASHKQAQQAFERALEIDPSSIDARIGMARVLVENLVQGWSNFFEQDSARAERLLLEVLERHTRLSPAHLTMGMLRRVQNRLTEARVEFETAIALGAHDEFAHGQLGWTLLFLGLPEAGLIEGEKALRLSLHGPDRWGTYLQLGWCHLLSNGVEPAIDLLIKSRAANPRPWVTHFGLAAALALNDDLDGAKAALAESLKLNPEVNSLARFRAYRPWGNPQYWTLYGQSAAVGLRRTGFPNE
jgi:TolB-like protein/Tfp pilus assembly protein PilF